MTYCDFSSSLKETFNTMHLLVYHTGLKMSYKPGREAITSFIKFHLTLKPSSCKTVKAVVKVVAVNRILSKTLLA